MFGALRRQHGSGPLETLPSSSSSRNSCAKRPGARVSCSRSRELDPQNRPRPVPLHRGTDRLKINHIGADMLSSPPSQRSNSPCRGTRIVVDPDGCQRLTVHGLRTPPEEDRRIRHPPRTPRAPRTLADDIPVPSRRLTGIEPVCMPTVTRKEDIDTMQASGRRRWSGLAAPQCRPDIQTLRPAFTFLQEIQR